MRYSKVALGVIASAAVCTVVLAACTSAGRQYSLSSAWPRASAERVVARPPSAPRWPLTGMAAPDVESTTRRIVSVKIENSPAARPQTALNQADVVYESLAEGGITRFNALFHSQDPKDIGPVRSARLSDTWIVPQYGAVFFFSGASSFVTGRLRSAGLPLLSEDAGVTRPFYRSSSRSAPHNLFLKGDLTRPEAADRGLAATQTVRPFSFDYRRPDATPTVTSIFIPFSPANRVQWTYDAGRREYLRENNGKVHHDAATGAQVATKNVVVIWAVMRAAGPSDKAGNNTFDIVLGGKNRVSVFRDGVRFDGMWYADAKSPPVFKSSDGKAIRLAPGPSWFEVIPTSVNITLR